MNAAVPTEDPDKIRALYAAKAAAEIGDEETGGVSSHGPVEAEVVLVKGAPGQADREAGHALAGGDGEAAAKALAALGLVPDYFATCSRPEGGAASPEALERLAARIEAVDPLAVVALDAVAAADLAAVLGVERLEPGVPLARSGRTYLAVEGLEASLADEGLKRSVWRQMQALRRAEG